MTTVIHPTVQSMTKRNGPEAPQNSVAQYNAGVTALHPPHNPALSPTSAHSPVLLATRLPPPPPHTHLLALLNQALPPNSTMALRTHTSPV